MTTTESSDGTGGEARASSSTWTWLLPVLTFLVGCVLGGVVVAAGGSDADGERTAAPTPATTADQEEDGADPSPGPTDLVVRVPQSCLDAADGATEATGQVDDVVAAVRDLDARRLQEIVDRIQQVQPRVQRLAEQCRSVAGQRLQDGELATSAPVPSPTP